MRTLYLDLETTGLDPVQDEILEIAILDDDGQPVLNTLVRPIRRTEWPKAQAINGIAPADVRDAPPLEALRPAIAAAVRDARVVIYNAPFDTGFLPEELAQAAEVCCAMRAFADLYGDWDPKRGEWKWQRLSNAAATICFTWNTAAHRALADCLATRAVWHHTQDPALDARRTARQREAAVRRGELAPERAARRNLALIRLRALLGLDPDAPSDRPLVDPVQVFNGTRFQPRPTRCPATPIPE